MENLNKVKAIVTYKSIFFNLFQNIDKIYFDTFGEYSFLKEAEDKSDWKLQIDFERIIVSANYEQLFHVLTFYNKSKNVNYVFKFPNNDKFDFIVIKDSHKTYYSLKFIKQNIFEIEFLKSSLSYEDVF